MLCNANPKNHKKKTKKKKKKKTNQIRMVTKSIEIKHKDYVRKS